MALSKNQIAVEVLNERRRALLAEIEGIDGTIASLGGHSNGSAPATGKRKVKRDMSKAHAAAAAARAAKKAAKAAEGASLAEAAEG